MVKLDLSRDYYGDLEMCPTSSGVEIKKQYKKLALIHHPDRNVGSNNLDSTKFQRIQAAYEILIDPTQRAKYDAHRRVGAFTNVNGSRTRSSTKGNPWSNIGKDYPPPPKAYNASNFPIPPTSSRYRKNDRFSSSQQSAYQAAQEGSQARKETYDAWEKSRGYRSNEGTDSRPQPPPREKVHSDRKKNSFVPPTQPQASSNANDDNMNNGSQSHNTQPNRKKGFMPSTPGGDELPAPKGLYFTTRASPNPPPIPLRNYDPPISPQTHPSPGVNDIPAVNSPLKPRTGTPFTTISGERSKPFDGDSANLGRSKSTREFGVKASQHENSNNAGTSNSQDMPTPQRARSYAGYSNTNLKFPNESGVEQSITEGIFNVPHTTKHDDGAPAAPRNVTIAAATPISNRIIKDFKSKSRAKRSSTERFPACPLPSIPLNSEQEDALPQKNSTIFSFNTKYDKFASSQYAQQEGKLGDSKEKINTKFSAEDWNGKFSAGSNPDYFKPNPSTDSIPPYHSQNGTRVRTRSPSKSHVFGIKRTARSNFNQQNPSGKTYVVEEPTPISAATRSGAGEMGSGIGTKPSTVPTPGPNTLSLGNRLNLDSSYSNTNTLTPEPMDIDTPSGFTANPTISKFTNSNIHTNTPINLATQSCPASYSVLSLEEDEARASALKVNFSDLKIKDLILDFPLPPAPPKFLQESRPSNSSYRDCKMKFQQYMTQWDQFDKKFLLHLVARRNKYESLGDKRWKGQETEYYRSTIREDEVVLRKWAEAKETHEKVVTSWILFKDTIKALGRVE